MSQNPKSPPARMRAYRVEAELRETPDLHKLAQLFIGMASARTDSQQSRPPRPSSSSRQEEDDKV